MEKVTIVTLIVLLLLAGMQKDELASMLHTLYPDTQVFEKDNHIHTFKGRLAG